MPDASFAWLTAAPILHVFGIIVSLSVKNCSDHSFQAKTEIKA